MSWWYEYREYPSDKNGLIRCRRLFGRWRVTVDGFDQTTSYTNTMWRRALRRVPRQGVKRVLLLGLGAGGAIPLIARRFRNPAVTVMEWDPVMVRIAIELMPSLSRLQLAILRGDATELVPNLQEKFDVVIVDLFRGHRVLPALATSAFVQSIARVATRDGYVMVNAFRQPEIFTVFDQALSRHAMWRFKYNRLALFRPFGCGRAGDPLPSGYIHFKQSFSYLRGDIGAETRTRLIGSNGCLGMRWWHGPLCFEGYETDVEPRIEPGPRRMVIWQPLTRLDKPDGWHRSWLQMNFRRTGFAEIVDTDAYWKTWADHAKRHRRRWLRANSYVITDAPDEAFIKAYRAGTHVPRYLRGDFVKMVERRRAMQRNDTHLFAAHEPKTGQIVAGLAVVDTPDAAHSTHLISFIHPSAAATSVGTGLIDYWFQHCIQQGIRFLNFGVFWTFGDPWSWRGFSRFKSQFGIRYIHRPNPLIRFVGASQPRG